MAKCEFPAGIESISGTLQNFNDGSKIIVRNYKSGPRVFLIGPDTYKRKSPVSENERRNRLIFKLANEETSRLRAAGDPRPRQTIFHEAYSRIKNGGITEALPRQKQTNTHNHAKNH